MDRIDKHRIYELIDQYVGLLKMNGIPLWRVYLFGPSAGESRQTGCDIDLAIFWDLETLDGVDEDVILRKFKREIDQRIQPYSFARTDFDETHPLIRDIIENGEWLY
ncbi:MAG: hypothetical protein PHW04_09520 [Candidatus Wallbacteria bacterium]|nr:hypothetical protein [Candidatus Wallbacteria bacterium]